MELSRRLMADVYFLRDHGKTPDWRLVLGPIGPIIRQSTQGAAKN
jgi:hypothetical protein